MENKKILLSAVLILFLVMHVFSGCGTAPVKKEPLLLPDMGCDKEADMALKNKSYEKSIILHEFFIKENPDNGLAMYHMGFSYGQLGEHDREVKYYEKAISLGFYGSGIFFNLGMAYGEMGRYDDSVRIFNKAMEIEPNRADNHFGLGLAYQRMASYDLAEKEFKKAIRLDPEDVDSFYYLGVQYAGAGRIDEAKNLLEKLMKIDPDNDMALELKRLLEEKSEDHTGN